MYVCTCIIIIVMGGMNASELINKNKWITVGCFSFIHYTTQIMHVVIKIC